MKFCRSAFKRTFQYTFSMPFAPKIRKQMLSALNGHIIPALQSQVIPQVLAGPPFDFSHVPHHTEQKVLLADKKVNPLNVLVHWEKEHLVLRRMSQLAFVYRGMSQERVGITRKMARSLRERHLPAPAGITAIAIKAPAAFYVPAQMPHGGSIFAEKQHGVLRMLVAQFTERELLLRHFDSEEGGTHHLNIADPTFKKQEEKYVHLLQQRQFPAAQLQLLKLMQQLRDYLTTHAVHISNSSWPPLDDKSALVASHVSPACARLCYQAIDYIQFHLHTPLSMAVIARHCGVTPEHLSRVFRQSVGMPLMHYVTERRLRAAELMLVQGSERIGDIAKLTGFSSSHSFAIVFQRHHGVSPSRYRQAGSG
jgi:AraC-like DNA-binding protein